MPNPLGLPLPAICGHLLRRAQQVHNALWLREVGAEPTSPQYAVLVSLAAQPGSDQRRVAELASLDTSSAMDVVARLERSGHVARARDERDRRRYVLVPTPAALRALDHLRPRVQGVQDALLAPLAADRREALLADLAAVGRLGDEVVQAPSLRIPGHLVRRAQQVHTTLFTEEFGASLTGPQYAALHVMAAEPDLSQSQVGERAALDKSTVGDIIDRLVRRRWVERRRDHHDGRRRILRLTELGEERVDAAAPRITGEGAWQHLAPGFGIGTRFHSVPVLRVGDAKPMHLGHVAQADGRWRLYAFADSADPRSDESKLRALAEWLETDAASPVVRFTPADADPDAVFDLRAVLQTSLQDIDVLQLPPLLAPRKGRYRLIDFEKAFTVDPRAEDAYAMRGVDREAGALVVVRPDQYIAHVLPLDAHDELAAFFERFLLPVA